MNGYVQDVRYTAGAGSAGAVSLSFARCLTHGCAARLCQFCMVFTETFYLHGRRGREVPFFRTRYKHIHVRSGATSLNTVSI